MTTAAVTHTPRISQIYKTAVLGFATSDDRETKAERRRRRRTGGKAFPLLAGGAVAGGLGLVGVANAMASNADMETMRQARAGVIPEAFTDNTKLPLNETGLTHYQKALTGPASLRPFGIPAGKYMAAIRQDPDIVVEALGIGPSYVLTDESVKGVGGLPHYKSFAAGPVRAYAHQLKAGLRSAPVPVELAGQPGRNYASWMGDKLEEFVSREAGGVNPFEIDSDIMPREKQLELMERFHASLPPEVQAYRKEVETAGQTRANQVNNYLPPAEKVMKVRNQIRDLGVTAASAGAGGLTGNLLYRYFRDRDQKSNPLYQGLATAAGAGVGGAAGHYLGTEKGRAVIGRLLYALKRKALGLPPKLGRVATPPQRQPTAAVTKLLNSGTRVPRLSDKVARLLTGPPVSDTPEAANEPPTKGESGPSDIDKQAASDELAALRQNRAAADELAKRLNL